MRRGGRRRARAPGPEVLQPAYVLHQWDWSETSLILDLFTRGQGRVAAVAKGAKRPYSQLRPVLVSFQRLQVQLGKSKAEEGSDILGLRSAEYAGGGVVLSPSRLMAGFYCNELLLKLLARNDPHERLFDAYAGTLASLSTPGLAVDEEAAALRAFELLLLRDTGVLPELDRATASQTPVDDTGRYRLRPEAGLVDVGGVEASDDPQLLTGVQCRALQRALDEGRADALRHAARAALPALRGQLRALLHYHLGSTPLRTRALMLDLRRLLGDASPPSPNGSP